MKRLGIVLVGLVFGVVGLVGAGMSLDSNGAYDVEIYLREGWNIVAGTLPSDGIAADSEIQESDIRAMWYYSPMSEEYMRVHPNLELNKLQQEDDDIVFTSAMWVYVNKNGYLKYNTLEDYPALGDRQLYAGYNFVTITPDMNEKSFNDFIDCDIEKVYFWHNGNQEWYQASEFAVTGLGVGAIVKVSNDCTLEISSDGVASPPGLPQEIAPNFAVVNAPFYLEAWQVSTSQVQIAIMNNGGIV